MNVKNFQFSAPYPPLQVEAPNPYYARILSQDFASQSGEFSAINLYNYQHWCLKQAHPSLADSLAGIARIEMIHLEILATLILLLGGQPKYQFYESSCCIPWKQNMINYQTDPASLLQYNIATEQIAIQCYKDHILLINDKKITAILARIIEDEEIHLNYFSNELSSFYDQRTQPCFASTIDKTVCQNK